MKKKLLIALSIMILATSGSVFAKQKISTELSDIISMYKAGNYSECYVKLGDFVQKDPTNALAYYYYAMANAQLGKSEEAISNYEKAINLSANNSNLNKFAKKGKLCLESPDKCSDSLYSSEEEEFIRNLKGPKFSKSVKGQYDDFKLQNMMREMNRSNDINVNEFNEYRDFSSMNSIQGTPSNDEIVAALRTLQRAGLSNTYNMSDVTALSGLTNQAPLMNMLGGSSMNQQLIQSMLTNNMTLGF